MSDKHTPGPWEWDSNPCNYDPHNEAPWLWQAPWSAKESFPILTGGIKCGNKSDANLIAAAPELLAALRQMRDAFIGTSVEVQADALRAARAAIAKAEASE